MNGKLYGDFGEWSLFFLHMRRQCVPGPLKGLGTGYEASTVYVPVKTDLTPEPWGKRDLKFFLDKLQPASQPKHVLFLTRSTAQR